MHPNPEPSALMKTASIRAINAKVWLCLGVAAITGGTVLQEHGVIGCGFLSVLLSILHKDISDLQRAVSSLLDSQTRADHDERTGGDQSDS